MGAVSKLREFPFREHRDMRQVLETEDLVKRQRRGSLSGSEARLLQSLQSRATEPSYRDEPPPAA